MSKFSGTQATPRAPHSGNPKKRPRRPSSYRDALNHESSLTIVAALGRGGSEDSKKNKSCDHRTKIDRISRVGIGIQGRHRRSIESRKEGARARNVREHGHGAREDTRSTRIREHKGTKTPKHQIEPKHQSTPLLADRTKPAQRPSIKRRRHVTNTKEESLSSF